MKASHNFGQEFNVELIYRFSPINNFSNKKNVHEKHPTLIENRMRLQNNNYSSPNETKIFDKSSLHCSLVKIYLDSVFK